MITFDEKYGVLKHEDLANALHPDELQQLGYMVSKVRAYRESQGKPATNQYLVVNIDEPYAYKVAMLMKQQAHYNVFDKGKIQVHQKNEHELRRHTLKHQFEQDVVAKANIGRALRYLVVAVKLPTGAVELIVNTDNLMEKAQYYGTAYDDYFQLRTNPMVQVVDYLLV